MLYYQIVDRRCSEPAGATLPLFAVIFGDIINALGGSPTIAELVHQVNKVHAVALQVVLHHVCSDSASVSAQLQRFDFLQVCLYFVYLGIVAFVASYAEVGLWMWTGRLCFTLQHCNHIVLGPLIPVR